MQLQAAPRPSTRSLPMQAEYKHGKEPQERPSACGARRRACAAGTNAKDHQRKVNNFCIFYIVLFMSMKSIIKSTIFKPSNSTPLSALC